MERVKFIQMKDGAKEDYLLLEKHEKKFIESTADRLIKFMSGLSNTLEGYQITRLEHSLQTATRALNDKVDDEMVLKFTPKGLREVMGRNYEIISCPKIQEKND